MGTEITLDVERVSLTYSKNHRGMDHGALFQESDRRPVRSDQLDYDYYKDHEEDATAAEMAFTRPLKDVVARLELLGFNFDRIRREYEIVAESWREERQAISDDEDIERLPDLMSFAEFCEFATEYPLSVLDDTFSLALQGGQQDKIRGRFAKTPVDRIPGHDAYALQAYSERSYFGGTGEHPASLLCPADSSGEEGQ